MREDDRRFAVLRFELHVEYHPSEGAARRRLAELPPLERVAAVDRETGTTHCVGDHMQMVARKLESLGKAPAELRRAGTVAAFLRQDRRLAQRRRRSSSRRRRGSKIAASR